MDDIQSRISIFLIDYTVDLVYHKFYESDDLHASPSGSLSMNDVYTILTMKDSSRLYYLDSRIESEKNGYYFIVKSGG